MGLLLGISVAPPPQTVSVGKSEREKNVPAQSSFLHEPRPGPSSKSDDWESAGDIHRKYSPGDYRVSVCLF